MPGREAKESDELLSYRMQRVEEAVAVLSAKVDHLDNIKKADLVELRDTIVDRITEVRRDLQKQIDGKADRTELADLKKLIYGFAAFFGTILSGVVVFYLTNKR